MITASEARRTTEERIKRLNAASIKDAIVAMDEAVRAAMSKNSFSATLTLPDTAYDVTTVLAPELQKLGYTVDVSETSGGRWFVSVRW